MIIKTKDYFNKEIEKLKEGNYFKALHIIQIGNNEASNTYVKNKLKDFEAIGYPAILHKIGSTAIDVGFSIYDLISDLNKDSKVSGIMVQLPIPEEKNHILTRIEPIKDVDNLNPAKAKTYYNSCTPKGIIDYLKRNNFELDGQNIVVVGRSNIVGKPLAVMLTEENATVTLCHSHTKNLKEFTRRADIVICAIGKAKMFTKDYFTGNQIVIDVGINFVDGKMCGDVDAEDVDTLDNMTITSVPGGVGLLTRLALLENCIEAHERLINEQRFEEERRSPVY